MKNSRFHCNPIPRPFLAFDPKSQQNYAWGQRGWVTGKGNLISVMIGEWPSSPLEVDMYRTWLGRTFTVELINELKANRLDISQWPLRKGTLFWVADDLATYHAAHGEPWPFHTLVTEPGKHRGIWMTCPGNFKTPLPCPAPEKSNFDPEHMKWCRLRRNEAILERDEERRQRRRAKEQLAA